MQIHYLPNIAYFQEFITDGNYTLHLNDIYSRRTNRNRTEIMGPNGKLLLTIPTLKLEPNEREYENIRLSYSESWLKQHWKSFESCYRRSIYFEYYEDKFKIMFDKPQYEYLWQFNYELILTISKILKIDSRVLFEKVELAPKETDYKLKGTKEYQQVFSNKYAFEPNLSVLDLIFNTGPQAIQYLSL